jgi:GT2 family glycosyltransferase
MYGEAEKCFYPSGGLCLLRLSAIAPLLPEVVPQRYFAYYEDAWLGYILRGQGRGLLKEPRAAAVHVAGSTARRMGGARRRFWQERNRCLNILGCYPAGVLWRLVPLRLLAVMATGTALFFTRPAQWWGWLVARVWLLFHPLEIANHRQRCRSQMGVDEIQWMAELSGNVRGNRGLLNWLSRSWCRVMRVPHFEDREGR